MPQPNLLFLFTDEQRTDTMAAYGNTKIDVPNLNRLADQSTVFAKAYVTQPVCTPSRATIMTGLYPHTCGCVANNIPLPADVPCLPEMISRGRYVAGYHGKWHLGDELFAQHGFDDWVSMEDFYYKHFSAGRDRSARSDYHHWLIENGFTPADGHTFRRKQAARLDEEFSKPAFLARAASRFIRENASRRFILYVNFLEPHMPFFGPRDGQYDPDEIDLPGNFGAELTGDQPLKARMTRRIQRETTGPRSEAEWRRLIARYWGLCSQVDTHVGIILRTLEDCGLWDETIIVYTSDHGDMMGSHGLWAKCMMFEESVRVPMLIRLPGQRKGRRVARPVSQIDLVPTLLELMGEKLPAPLQGRSLAAEVRGADPAGQDEVFIEWNSSNGQFGRIVEAGGQYPDYLAEIASREQLAVAVADPVRTVITPGGWKFNCSPAGEHELYNLNDDPLEMTNLAGQDDSRPIMRELAESIRRWQRRTDDTVELPVNL